LDRANTAHTLLGYSFLIEQVAIAGSSTLPGSVDIDVTVQQAGVAPFYYDLSLVLSCKGITRILDGVESIIEAGEIKVFSFEGIPSTTDCLDKVSFTLHSPYSIEGRPIKFSQAYDGEVSLSLPIPASASAQSDEVDPGILFGLTLVGVYEDDSWTVVQSLHNDDVVDLSCVGENMSIRADTIGAVDAVDFWYNGGFWKREKRPIFALGGNRGDSLNIVFELGQPGTKTITAIAYSEAGAVTGNRTVTFSVLEAVDDAAKMYNPVLPDSSTISAYFTDAPSAQAASTAAPSSGTTDMPTSSPVTTFPSGQPNVRSPSTVAITTMTPVPVGTPTSNDNGEPNDLTTSPPTSDNAGNVHGFNTPATPNVMDLVDEMTNQQPKTGDDDNNRNPKLIAVIVGALAATAVILSLALYRVRRYKVLLAKGSIAEEADDTDSQETANQSNQGQIGYDFPLVDMESPVRPQY